MSRWARPPPTNSQPCLRFISSKQVKQCAVYGPETEHHRPARELRSYPHGSRQTQTLRLHGHRESHGHGNGAYR